MAHLSDSRRLPGRPRVVVTRQLLPSVEARMRELFDVTLNADDRPMDRGSLAAAMQGADVLVPCVTDQIDVEMIAQAGERLRLIASFGAGVDHIDLAAARARKIMVTNTPGVFAEDTADVAMSLIIGAPRAMTAAAHALRGGEWLGWGPSTLLGRRLGGKMLAILGMGRIGQAVARRARPFGLELVYHNRTRLSPALEADLGVQFEPDIDALVARADILSLHYASLPETRHILSAARIAAMKPEAYVINTGRGDLIDEEALIVALEAGKLGGAGLDVFANEPDLDPRLLKMPNVVILPHIGSATVEGREMAGQKVVANIQSWADGHSPPDLMVEGWA